MSWVFSAALGCGFKCLFVERLPYRFVSWANHVWHSAPARFYGECSELRVSRFRIYGFI